MALQLHCNSTSLPGEATWLDTTVEEQDGRFQGLIDNFKFSFSYPNTISNFAAAIPRVATLF